MRYALGPLLIATVTGALGAFAGSAHALTCAAPGVTAPMLDSTGVPTNTLIWCTRWRQESVAALQVTDAQGQLVSGTQTLLSTDQFQTIVFRPDAELAPHARYDFQCDLYPEARAMSFTTGAGPRTEPPALPNLEGMHVSADADTGWGASLLARFEGISGPDTIVVLDLDGGSKLDATALSGSVEDADLIQSAEGSAFVGKAPCVDNWPGAELGASTRVRFGAFDLTGAFSGWTDWQTVTLPEEFQKQVGTSEPQPIPVSPPVAAPDVAPERASDVEEQTLTGNGAPINEVVSADLASDSAATPSPKSSGCQLGARGGTSWAAGLLAALALGAAQRRRRNARG